MTVPRYGGRESLLQIKGRIDGDGTSGRMESGHDPEPSEDRGREGNPVQQPGDPKRVESG